MGIVGARTIKREKVDAGQLVVFDEDMIDAAVRASVYAEKSGKKKNHWCLWF